MPDLKADSRDIASTEPDDDEIDTGPAIEGGRTYTSH